MKLSIIIPIYKAEKWISRCLNSIYNQEADNDDFEVLCVIDGSPDKSLEIVKQFQFSHSNIKLIVQKNQGVSVARNQGIDASSGEYIMFMDADDALFDNTLHPLMGKLNNDGSDIIICRAFTGSYEWVPWADLFKDEDVMNPADAVRKGYLRGCVWGGCYRRMTINDNNIRFAAGVSNGEDTLFFMTCMYFAKSICFNNIVLYNVIEEDNSLSRTYSKDKINAIIGYFPVLEELSNKYTLVDRFFILQYVKYSWLSALVVRTIRTRGVGYRYLKRAGINKYANFRLDNNTVALRGKMKLMSESFFMFYIFAWIKDIFRRLF